MSIETDQELQILDNKVTVYLSELYAFQQEGRYKGFSSQIDQFCSLLCARDYCGDRLTPRQVGYGVNFTDEALVPELKSLSGRNALVVLESMHRETSIMRIFLASETADIRPSELFRFTLSQNWQKGIETYHGLWAFSLLASDASALGAKEEWYQEQAVLKLLQATYRYGKITDQSVSLACAFACYR